MKYSRITSIQILREAEGFNTRLVQMNRALDIAAGRINKLRETNFPLEAISASSQLVELMLKCLVQSYSARRRVLSLLGEKDLYADVQFHLSDDETLGKLVGIVKGLHVNATLVSRLQSFNSLRKEAVHHLLDSDQEIEHFDSKVEGYFQTDSYKNILKGLLDEHRRAFNDFLRIVGWDKVNSVEKTENIKEQNQ